MADKYHLETVIVSHDAERPNFSENTNLSEIMFIARKLKKNELASDTTYVNLWHNPRTIYEAMDVAERIRECAESGSSGNAISARNADGRKLAEITQLPQSQGDSQWFGVQFAQALTLQAAKSLENGILAVLGVLGTKLQTSPLCALGRLGYDQRDVHDAFTVSTTEWSPYPAFWNHDAKTVTGIAQSKNSWLSARSIPAKGRNLKNADLVAQSAGTILLVERIRSTTHRVLAVGFSETVLGNTWWAFKSDLSSGREKALLLWLNSTPSLLILMSHRVTTEGVWMKFKKPQWSAMPVLDVRTLSDETIDRLALAYDEIACKELLALAKLDVDPVRAEIDNCPGNNNLAVGRNDIVAQKMPIKPIFSGLTLG